MAGLIPQAGFYYQNIVAAHRILEMIDVGNSIRSIELDNYEKAEHIDDVIINYNNNRSSYFQIKWSAEEGNTYTLYNLATSTDESARPLIEDLALGYKRLSYPLNSEVILYTNRRAGNRKQPSHGYSQSLMEFLRDVHTPYIQLNIVDKLSALPNYPQYEQTIHALFKSSGLSSEAEFCEFLHILRFQFNQPAIDNQREKLREKLHSLGIEAILYDSILNSVVEWSLTPQQAITGPMVLTRLGLSERFTDSIGQDFRVDQQHYVKNSALFQQLDSALSQLKSGFVFLEGTPGSGKSTALTMYQRERDEIRFIYYCYVPNELHIGNARMEKETFLKSLCIGIQNAFPDIDFPQKFSMDYEAKLNLWLAKLSEQAFRIVLIVDGLDHVQRKAQADELSDPLTNALGGHLPDNIIMIISAQYVEALPLEIKGQVIAESSLRHIRIAKFGPVEIVTYLNQRGINLPDKLVPLVIKKSEGIPLYLHYIANKLQDTADYEYESTLKDFPFLEESNINTYHQYLYDSLSHDDQVAYILAVLANRAEYTSLETLIEILGLLNVSVSRHQAASTLSSIKHLLNTSDARTYAIMHDSFRQYILRRSESLQQEVLEALIRFYQANRNADESYRNYFRHLFELGRYEQVLLECNHQWMEVCWQDFRPLQEITENLRLAWQAALESESFKEYIRIAFLMYQFHLIKYYLEETANFKAQEFLLEIGNSQDALHSVWDGTRVIIHQTQFAQFAYDFFKQTGQRIPERIAMESLDRPDPHLNVKALRTFSHARALYPGWEDHFERLTTYKWAEETSRQHISTEISPEQNHATNLALQIDMLQGLFDSSDFDGLVRLARNLTLDNKVRNHALIHAVHFLQKADEVQEAELLLKEIDFSILQTGERDRLVIMLAEHQTFLTNSLVNLTASSPQLFEKLLEDNPNYKLKNELFELYDSLRVCFLQDSNGYHSYVLKAGLYQMPEKGFFLALIELAHLWCDTVHNRVEQTYQVSRCKEILNHLNIDRANIDLSNQGMFDPTFIRQDIHRVYILLFDYLVQYLESDQILSVVQHWISVDTGGHGYKSSTTNLEFAKRLSKLADNNLQPFILALLGQAETQARVDEETATLVSELLECVKAYGHCGFIEDVNRLWREIYSIACGVNYRKDYQFNEAIAALELAHEVSPTKSLARIAKLFHLAHQLEGTGRANITARAFQYLIAFTSSISLELGLELLHQEDISIYRENGIQDMMEILSRSPRADLRYLWSVVKTMGKWEDFRDYRDTTQPTMLDFFETVIKSGDNVLGAEIYDFCKQQFIVEKEMPEGVYDLEERCQRHDLVISSSLEDLNAYKPAKEAALQRQSDSQGHQRAKQLHPIRERFHELLDLSGKDFAAFSQEIERIYERYVRAERKRSLKRGQFILQEVIKAWQKEREINNKEVTAEPLPVEIAQEYIRFSQKVRGLPVFISESKYNENVTALCTELRTNLETRIQDQGLLQYFDRVFDLPGWIKDITSGGVSSYEGEREIADHTNAFLERAALTSLPSWEEFCRRWLKHNELTKAMLQIAIRLKRVKAEHSQELLIEAWEANSQFFYEYGGSAKEFFNVFFDVAPEQAKKLLLQSFYIEHERYPGQIIHRIDTLARYADRFENDNAYDYMYEQFEQHNELLANGLSAKPTDYSWVENYERRMSDQEAISQYLCRLLEYPEIEVRKLAINAILSLTRRDRAVLDYVISFYETATDNGKEHILSLLYTVILDQPDWAPSLSTVIFSWLEYPHFNIKQSAKEILIYCMENLNLPFEKWQIDKIRMTNRYPQVLIPTLEEGQLLEGRRFIPSAYQSQTVYKICEYQNDKTMLSRLYTRLRYKGWDTKRGMEEENRVHKRHNINTNFDTIEINGPYFQATQESINYLLDKEIKERRFDDDFIDKMRFQLRLYDPSDPLLVSYSRPNDVNRVDQNLSSDQFLGFEDLTSWSKGWKLLNDDWISLYESGHQRVGDQHSSGIRQTSYFDFTAFLVSASAQTDSLDLMTSQSARPFIYLENVYLHELPYMLTDGKTFPIPGIRPILGISKRSFRGQNEVSIAALLPDFASELQIVPTKSLNYGLGGENIARNFQWQEKYDQDRRRQKPVAAGIRLQIKKDTLIEYLLQGHWNICYIFNVRRSIDKYTSEEDMSWVNFHRIGKLALPEGNIEWLS